MSGRLCGILIGRDAGSELSAESRARLEAGRGIVGDRYYHSRGTFSKKFGGTPAVEATLIAQERIDAFNAATGRSYTGRDFRRNLVTEGIDLADLVGVRFRIGDAVLAGIRFCEPCAHLAGILGHEIMDHMVHRAGIRAQIVSGGTVRVGDAIEPGQRGIRS